MDHTDSGFRAGFRRGLRVAWDAMCSRPFRFEPWPAPPMPSLREHLECVRRHPYEPGRFRPVRRCLVPDARRTEPHVRPVSDGHALRTVRAVRCMDSRVCDCRTDPGRSVVVNRSEVLPSTTEQGIVRAGAGEHEAQFAMIDPVDKKPVALDVEFAESRPFAFQRVIPVRVDQRIRVFGHQGLYRLTQFGGIVVLPSQTFPVSFEGRRPGYVVKHRGPPSDRPRCRTFCRYRSAPRVSPACFRQL